MSRLSGCGGILIGVLIILLSAVYIILAPQAQAFLGQLPLVGDWLADVFQKVLYFPNAQYICPLFAIVSILWGVALMMKKSWARVMGFVFLALAGLYVLALLLVVAPLEEVQSVRWWIVAFGLAVSALLFVMAIRLLGKEARESFAQVYLDAKDFDLVAADSQPPLSPAPGSTAPPPVKKAEPPELARLIPADPKSEPFVMRQPLITLGREGTDFQFDLSDTSLSRRHADISYVDGQFFLEDKSQNGTKVNGQLIKRQKVALPDGATIELGRQGSFTFKALAQQTALPPASSSPVKPPATAVQGAESKTTPLASGPLVPAGTTARLEALWPGGKTFELVMPKVTIGRNPDCDLALSPDADRSVSGQHAEIERTAQGEYVLRDTSSSNGTFVDTQRIAGDFVLKDNMEIRFGTQNTRFKFRNS
ncbi:MAG: FHA domain-containing protein [Myxococcota bacterium]|jgi:pSer/pThr/pTyr-binding forkhead associated (FHA) protein|nr:FHA domain-containing protein [Myxococcota bacterium]